YCTGRSVRGRLASGDSRPETIEETAELVTSRGGKGIAVRVDHTVEAEVEALCERIRAEAGRLDLLVNDIWGGESLLELGTPFWKQSPQKARLMFERAVFTHVVTSRYAVPLMVERDRGLIVEVTDGDSFGYRGSVAYDVTKMAVLRLAFAMSRDLRRTNVTALAVTPGFLRSEEMLAHFGVTEANWRDAAKKTPDFIASETPAYVGRAVAALAAEPGVKARAGRVFASWTLAREFGFTDVDGSQPHWAEHFEKAYGKPYPVADDAAYGSWLGGAIETVAPDWPVY
ncbi:SDR family oxidoreductase, partial [Corallococcus llansteffanensis]